MGKSWFYLTLWHGTPPEMTETIDAEVEVANSATAAVTYVDKRNAEIATASNDTAEIAKSDATGAEIITATEVVWYVG